MKPKPKRRNTLRVLPPGPPPIDDIEQARAAKIPTAADQIRECNALAMEQSAARNRQVAQHARELAELLTRQADEETKLEHTQRIETGRLWRSHGRSVPWLEYQEERGIA